MGDHSEVKKWIEDLVAEHRDRIGIEKRWKIHVNVLCSSSKDRAALVRWIPDTYEAALFFQRDMPKELLEREAIHELVELSLYRSGTIIDQFARRCRGSRDIAEFFMSQYRIARNQEVEQIVSIYLGEVCHGTN